MVAAARYARGGRAVRDRGCGRPRHVICHSPGFPTRFESIEHARAFCREFFDAYNHNMYHSGIAMLTPATVHQGQAHDVIERRQNVHSQAFNAHPERFVNGMPAHRLLPREVWINKPLEDPFQVVIS